LRLLKPRGVERDDPWSSADLLSRTASILVSAPQRIDRLTPGAGIFVVFHAEVFRRRSKRGILNLQTDDHTEVKIDSISGLPNSSICVVVGRYPGGRMISQRRKPYFSISVTGA